MVHFEGKQGHPAYTSRDEQVEGVCDFLVSEIFGPTFQGEGKHAGQICVFLRLGGCNLACTWCDTPYTWAFDERHAALHHSGKQYDPRDELRRIPVDEVAIQLERLLPRTGGLVVISGGEPLLQQESIAALINLMPAYRFEIETAGTRVLEGALRPLMVTRDIKFNISPKLAHSGNPLSKRFVLPALESLIRYRGRFILKFVSSPETWNDDVREILYIWDELKTLRKGDIWIMPLGTTETEVLDNMKALAPLVLQRGWNLTTRLHTLIWGNTRGV